jgi:hypothetical protein
MIELAERDGFIVVTPLGYHTRGGYGSLAALAGAQPAAADSQSAVRAEAVKVALPTSWAPGRPAR